MNEHITRGCVWECLNKCSYKHECVRSKSPLFWSRIRNALVTELLDIIEGKDFSSGRLKYSAYEMFKYSPDRFCTCYHGDTLNT